MRSKAPLRPSTGRPRHQRILQPRSDSTRADIRLTIIVFSVTALLAAVDFVTVRSGNSLLLAVVVLGYSFFRAGQGWIRWTQLTAR